MVEEISPRSKKGEIYDAYQDLLKKYESVKESGKKEKEVKQTEKKEIVKKAADYQSEQIIQQLTELKLAITRMLSDIGEQMVEKEKELKQLQEAIGIETQRLKEIHQISCEADTLAELLKLHQDEKEKYEEEIEDLKLEYETKKKAFQKQFEEEKAEVKKEWKKEEDEYTYNLKIKHKKAQDALDEELTKKRRDFEEETSERLKDIEERERDITDKEVEFERLKAQVGKFEKEMAERLKAVEGRVKQELEREFKHEKQMLLKTYEGEKNLADFQIENLKASVDSLQKENLKLKEELHKASKQVQEIALKTIEGHSGKKALDAVNTIAIEQARGTRGRRENNNND